MDTERLVDDDYLFCQRGWLAALRGDAATAETMLGGSVICRPAKTPGQGHHWRRGGFRGRRPPAPGDRASLRRATLAHADALGISHDFLRWAWPLAARCSYELRDTAVTRELLALLDSYQPGGLAPMLRAERDLVRSRLAAQDDDQAAAARSSPRSEPAPAESPYHLAHGLLDQAEHLIRLGDPDAAAPGDQRRQRIGRSLRCQPLLDRAGDIMPAKSRIRA